MKRTKIMGLATLTAFVVVALGASTASANVLNPPEFIFCAMVAKAGTGTFEKNTCEGAAGTKGFIPVKFPSAKVGTNECAEVFTAKTGNFEDSKCTKAKAASEFVEIKPLKFKFTDKEGESHFFAPKKIELMCKKDTSKGTITGPKTVAEVTVIFAGCKGKEGSGASCSINSPGQATGVIATETLSGSLGTVATSEATSGVGEDLKPTTGSVFTKLVSTCLSPTSENVEGSVIGEVEPINKLQSIGKLNFLCESAKLDFRPFTRRRIR